MCPPHSPLSAQRIDDDASVHDRLLWAIHLSGMDDLLLFLSSSSAEQQWSLHVLEIVSLMFRDQVRPYAGLVPATCFCCEAQGALVAMALPEEGRGCVPQLRLPSKAHQQFSVFVFSLPSRSELSLKDDCPGDPSLFVPNPEP